MEDKNKDSKAIVNRQCINEIAMKQNEQKNLPLLDPSCGPLLDHGIRFR